MIKHGCVILLCILTSLISSLVLADEDKVFDPIIANQTLDKLSIKLSIQDVEATNLENAITVLTDLQTKADTCVNKSESEIQLIDEQLAAIVPGAEKGAGIIEDKKTLEAQKSTAEQRLSNCRLFLLRSREATSAFRETVQKLVTTELKRKSPTLIENIAATKTSFLQGFSNLDWPAFTDRTGMIYWNMWIFSLFSFFSVLGAYLGILLRKFFKEVSAKQGTVFLKKLVAQRSIYWALTSLLLFTLFFLQLVDFFYASLTYFSWTALAALFYLTFCMTVSCLSLPNAKYLVPQLKILALLQILYFLIPYIFQPEHIDSSLISLVQTVFIVVQSLNFTSILIIVCYSMGWLNIDRFIRVPILILIFITFMTIISSEIFGYTRLSVYLTNGLIYTLLMLGLVIKCCSGVNLFFNELEEGHANWSTLLRNLFGVKKSAILFEFIVLRLLAIMTLWSSFIYVFLYLWRLNEILELVKDTFLNGFKISDISITPLRLLLGLTIFIFLHFLLRFVRTTYIKNPTHKADRSSREELATIFSYAFVGFSLVFCLLIAGVNFTGLAIVTGALSVGIGFGLQTIVNNFVSGLILLVERPIKAGDRVMVGSTEGYVKKISIRSTRIQTVKRSDVIVPNAELITSQVTNFMLTDTFGQIEISVGVNYDSNVALVKNILTKIAYEHPEIVHDDENRKTQVILKQFGESSLDFSLLCIIKDINMKASVMSDLHFAILNEFEKHRIKMPFPQRDIRITNMSEVTDESIGKNKT